MLLREQPSKKDHGSQISPHSSIQTPLENATDSTAVAAVVISASSRVSNSSVPMRLRALVDDAVRVSKEPLKLR